MCLIAQPAFSMAGEVHDAFEHAGTTSQHHETAEAHADDASGHADDDMSALRFLMHYAHCCASTNAVLAVSPTLPPAVASPATTLSQSGRGCPQTRPGHPFRPPIDA